MSDYDDNEDEEQFTGPKSDLQKRIANLMYNQGLSYSDAYDEVMNPKPKPIESFPTPTPQPKAKQFSVQNLEDLASEIDSALNTIDNEKATLKEKAARFQEKRNQLVEVAKEILEQEKSLNIRLEQQDKNEEVFKDAVERFNREVDNYNSIVMQFKEANEKAVKKKRAYVRKISSIAEKEFGEN